MLPVKIKGEVQQTCPRRPILDKPNWFSEVLSHYRNYKNGFLPVLGGMDVQPYKFVQIMNMVDTYKDEYSNSQEKPQETRQKGNPFAADMAKGK